MKSNMKAQEVKLDSRDVDLKECMPRKLQHDLGNQSRKKVKEEIPTAMALDEQKLNSPFPVSMVTHRELLPNRKGVTHKAMGQNSPYVKKESLVASTKESGTNVEPHNSGSSLASQIPGQVLGLANKGIGCI